MSAPIEAENNEWAEIPDTELMMRYKKSRDKKAFAELVRRHQKPLLNFFYRFSWDSGISEDLAQEVFIKLAQSSKNYQPRAKFNTFLYTIARMTWMDNLRTRKYRLHPVSLDQGIKDSDKDTTLKEMVVKDPKRPEEKLINKEMIDKVKETMKELHEEHQVIINLCVFQGMSYDDAAEVLKIPLGSVKSRLHFALAKLKELVKP
ncbi:MAG: sigma-70 family RNA polymerase sigma factor [Planctomycetes bacterium]|nr:sigma-70 family RNA polymerase sigma factor [Planctomycetota bacterium]